jgi:hypothetical protein
MKLLQQRELPALQLQQAFFEREAAAEAREAPVMSDHAVTRNNNRNRIRAIRGANCSHCSWLADTFRQLLVGNGFAVGNFPKFRPHRSLKLRAEGSQFQRERFSLSRKIFGQLPNGFGKHAAIFCPPRFDGHGMPSRGKAHIVQSRVRPSQKQ